MGGYFLVDGTNLLYRAYHALHSLQTSRGQPTHAVYGFLSMVFRILREHAPEGLAVVFDPPGPSHRHDLYPEYKANREATPDDLRSQIPFVHRAVRALGIPLLMVEGVEADDVLATLARRLSEDGRDVTIVTGDKDLCQLVGPRIRLLDTMRDRFTGPGEVRDRFGVAPDRVVDVLCLAGDAVDNVPGVPGIGVKTAAQLVERFGSVEEVVARAGEVGGKRGDALREHAERVLANRQLITVDTEVPVPGNADSLKPGPRDRADLVGVLTELEFHRFLRDLGIEEEEQPTTAVEVSEDVPADWVAVVPGEGAEDWHLATEKTSLACPPEELPEGWVRALADPDVPVVGHGLQRARTLLGRRGLALEGIRLDCEVAAYLLAPGRRGYPLPDLARERGVPAAAEGGGLARAARTLAVRLDGELEAAGLGSLYRDVENPLIPVLSDMELRGVMVDSAALRRLGEEYGRRLENLEARLFEAAGEEFNPNSPKQLGRILFEKHKLPVVRRTATGYSTDASVLEELSLDHPLPALVLEHRSLAKLKGSFIDVLPALADPATGRIHARFHQTVTATGRLSSSGPNLQNVPVKGEEGRRIREAFVAREGCRLLSADYSQVELRILAHFCEDPGLTQVFREGRDVHAETASRIFGVPVPEVDGRMRREAKTVNFGILYGMSAFGLARQLGIGREASQRMIDAYFRQFPRVREYLASLVDDARSRGYAETLLGRRRPIPELSSRNRAQREFGERMAVNTPIQGTAADLIKRAMISLHRELKERDLDACLILQVHDELVLEVGAGQTAAVRAVVVGEMERAADLRVPLVVEAGEGPNWYEAHP